MLASRGSSLQLGELALSEKEQQPADKNTPSRGFPGDKSQWIRLHASTAGGEGSIPGQGTKILHAMQCSQRKRLKKKNRLPSAPNATELYA